MDKDKNAMRAAAVQFVSAMARELPRLRNGNAYKVDLQFEYLNNGMWNIIGVEFYEAPRERTRTGRILRVN